MLTTFSSSHTLSNTEAAILSRRNRNRRNKSRSFSGFNKRRGERREARLTVMALGKDDDTEDKDKEEEDKEEEMSKLSRAMATARQNEKLGFSPGYVKGVGGGGGGVSSSVSSSLFSAEESAEAAFADLINTSSNDDRNEGEDDVKKLNLSELAKGSRMSEEAVRQKDTNVGGVLGDLINLGSILLKGGHIVKKKDGRV
jgi:hypothetical protein